MKIFIIILVFGILLIVLIQAFRIIPIFKTEEQKYSLVHKYKKFEIRYYPSATIATIYSSAKTYKDLSGPGFQKLAGYIFGGNEANTKISMTTPVQMDINDSVSTMSFVMPSGFTIENLPGPNDPDVKIKSTSDEYVAAIRFSGYASDEDLKLYSEKLHNLLQENGIAHRGNYRFLGYNPPFQFVGRRNEIIVAVDWNEK